MHQWTTDAAQQSTTNRALAPSADHDHRDILILDLLQDAVRNRFTIHHLDFAAHLQEQKKERSIGTLLWLHAILMAAVN